MTWQISYLRSAKKDIRKINRRDQIRLRRFLEERLMSLEHPRLLGKALKGSEMNLWRYRVGDYRIVCEIQDEVVTVLVVRIGHRKQIYR